MKAIHITITIISFLILFICICNINDSHRLGDSWHIILGLSIIVSTALIIGPKYLKSADSEKHTKIKIFSILSEDENVTIKEFYKKYKSVYTHCEEAPTCAVLYNMIKENDLFIQDGFIKIKNNI